MLILSQPAKRGGDEPSHAAGVPVAPGSVPLVHMVNKPQHLPTIVRLQFYECRDRLGFSYKPQHLPYVQLGMVCIAALSFMAWSAKAFYLLR